MELDVTRIKNNQPPALKTKLSHKNNEKKNSLDTKYPGVNRNQDSPDLSKTSSKSGSGKDQRAQDKRPDTTVGRKRTVSNKVQSGKDNPQAAHIPVIICDEVSEGDTPTQSRGFESGTTPDNNFFIQSIGQNSHEINSTPVLNIEQLRETERSPRRQSNLSEDDPERISSARSRKGSGFGQGSPKRQGESYVERLAKSRARHSATKTQPGTPQEDSIEAEALDFAEFARHHSYANKDLWSDRNLAKNTSQLQSALADFVSADIRQSPQRSMSFASTPLSLVENKKVRKVFSPIEHVEVTDADFDSDGEEKIKQVAKEDIVSLYERACRMAGITPSSRIARELANSRVFLDYAALNTQDIKAVCVALLSHSSITRLDLSGNELTPQAVQYICELVEENIFITHLVLETCQLREKATNSILQTVTNSKNMTTLDLSENKLHDEQLELIATMLRKNNNLRELRLSYCDIDEEGGFILAKALDETTLEVLDLSWNHLRQRGATAFCMALGDNDSIRELDLSWNGLGREGCAGLEAALAKNKYLVQLNLECNRVGSESLGHLLKGLEKNASLETLILSTNPLSTDDTKLIAASLKTALKTAIKVIDIYDVTVDDDFVAMQEELEERGISIYYGNILQRPKKEIKAGPRTLGSFDPILVLFEYMKQQNLRLIDLFRSLDVNRDNAISREELRNGFKSLNMHLPEGVFSSAFNKLDLNSNNLIDIDELKNAHRRVIRQTALMMLRSQRMEKQKEQEGGGGERSSTRFDLLHEFQKLVKEAAVKRKTVKLKDESDEEGGTGGDHGSRKMSMRPTPVRRNTSLIPGSPKTRRPSSGAVLQTISQGQQTGESSQ